MSERRGGYVIEALLMKNSLSRTLEQWGYKSQTRLGGGGGGRSWGGEKNVLV